MEYVILVDQNDHEIGTYEKLKAHQEGLLHRAFSIFIRNSEGKMLLHQRAKKKYHSGGLWTNACCSHPRPGESISDAALRRLQEEMGFITPLTFRFSFVYRAQVGDLIEHEFDHVLEGIYNGPVEEVNPEEVESVRWIDTESLHEELERTPHLFTEWFKIALPRFLNNK